MYSERFQDVYFSAAGGVEESTKVYVRGNDLEERFRSASVFTLAELGFGTSLNFHLTIDLWRKAAPKNARLHYVAFEKYPLTLAEIESCLKTLGVPIDVEFQALYPVQKSGERRAWVRLVLDREPRVFLTLIFGDVNTELPRLEAARGVQAWFCDGFQPRTNPEMWTETVFAEMARLSRSSGAVRSTLATFSVAGVVKRGLRAAGFSIEKTEGLGNKREHLIGYWPVVQTARQGAGQLAGEAARVVTDEAAIIGAGLAGTALVRSLVRRGITVDLFEKEKTLASGASSSPAAVAMPLVTVRHELISEYYFNAFETSRASFRKAGLFHETGVRVLSRYPRMSKRLEKLRHQGLWIPEDHAQFTDEPLGLLLPRAGWVEPAKAAQAWCDEARSTGHVRFHPLHVLESLERNATNGIWSGLVRDQTAAKPFSSGLVFLANSFGIASVRGLEEFATPILAGTAAVVAATERKTWADRALSFDHFWIPDIEPGRDYIGGTYHRGSATGDWEEPWTVDEDVTYLAAESQFLRESNAELRVQRIFSGNRSATPDALPMVGEVEGGLYFSLAHGSRGLVSSGYSAEILASVLLGEPVPLGRDVLAKIDPRRVPRL